MSETAARPARRWRKVLLMLAGAAFLSAIALVIYINTESFQSFVRRRLVAEVERITGGRAEIGSVHTVPFRLQAEVRNITVHGREAPTDVPLAHADRVVARLKVTSLLRSEFAFNGVLLDQPVIHVAFYPDGSTNIPPRTSRVSSQTSVEQLFSLSINDFELRGGRIIWDEKTIPLNLDARGLSLAMDYSFLHRRYDGRLSVGEVDTKLPGCRPFAWMTTASFALEKDSAVISSLQWNSGHSNVTARGMITDFRRPRIRATYDSRVDLTEAASITRRRDLRGGYLELKGDGTWSGEQFASNGFLAIRDLAWQDEWFSFSRASINSGYNITDQDLKFSKLQGKVFGGSVSGDAEFTEWLAPEQHLSASAKRILHTATISASSPAKAGRQGASSKAPSVQSLIALLRFRDMSAADFAAAYKPPSHPLQALHPAGLASGSLEARWEGSRRDAEFQFTLDVLPPAVSVISQLPLTAHATGTYHAANDTLNLPVFNLASPTSRVQASGALSSTSSLHLSVTTSSLADWLPLAAAVRGPSLFPVVLNGRATFNGTMSGSVSSPQLSGSVLVDDFEINVPATATTPAAKTQWDSLSTSIQLSFAAVSLHNAALRRGDTAVEFDAAATLQHGHLTSKSEFTVRANLQNTDVASLQALMGYHYPITGTADLSLVAAGTPSDAHGDGDIHLNHASAYGEPIQQFDSAYHFARGELAFDHMHLLHGDSVLTGSAAYNPTTRLYRLDIAGNNFNLAQVRRIQSDRLPVEGRADFTLKSSGAVNAAAMDADFHIHKLVLNHEPVGEFDLQAVTQGGGVRVTGSSHWPRGSLSVTGNVSLQDSYQADLSLRMDQLDLDLLWHAYLGAQLTGHSVVGGVLDLQGPLFQPGRWRVGGNLSALSLDLEHVALKNQDPIQFSIAERALHVQQLHMLGEGTDISARGSVQLSGARAIDLAAEGRLDLKLLGGLDPNLSAAGLVTMNLTVGGTVAEPYPQGRLQFSSGSLSYATLPSGVNDLNGTVLFTSDRIHIESLNAHTGGGTLAFQGDATYLNRQLNFNLSVFGKDVRLRYPPGVSSTADAQLKWVGTRSGSSVSGEITINKIAVTPGFDFSSYLERGRQGSPITVANSPLYNIKLDIQVHTAPELQMRTAIARLSGDADLHLRGSVARPAVLGRVDILEARGDFPRDAFHPRARGHQLRQSRVHRTAVESAGIHSCAQLRSQHHRHGHSRPGA